MRIPMLSSFVFVDFSQFYNALGLRYEIILCGKRLEDEVEFLCCKGELML